MAQTAMAVPVRALLLYFNLPESVRSAMAQAAILSTIRLFAIRVEVWVGRIFSRHPPAKGYLDVTST